MTDIKFGTDGWRAVIGEDFTPENVQRVIQAFCTWRRLTNPDEKVVILGYDRRLQSQESAFLAAEVLLGNGFWVKLSDQFCPTPCVSWMVKDSDAFAGIMITASHNPWQWNGIKFKEVYGGSASPEYTGQIEKAISENESSGQRIVNWDLKRGVDEGRLNYFSPKELYGRQLRSLVDLKAIKRYSAKILYDPLFGAGSGFLQEILGGQVKEIHSEADTRFGGVNPEPIDKNLGELMMRVREEPWDIGLSTDGDADRIGAVDEKGGFVNSHQIFALLLKHHVEDKGLRGSVVKSVSTTQMIPLLCKKYGLEVHETPIGFKHICEKLVQKDALMGGEESGGISFAPHLHERDGILNGLFLVEMMSQRKRTLSQLIRELYDEIGPFSFDRFDMHLTQPVILAMRERLSKVKIVKIAGLDVLQTNFIDGFKYILSDESWILVRASGTEPLVRIYAEAASRERVLKLIEEGKQLVGG